MLQFGLGQVLVAASTNAKWDLTSFLSGSFKTLGTWINMAIMIVGLVAVGYAVWQIISGLISHGKKQVNWAVTIILLVVGGVASTSTGFQFFRDIAEGGKDTIDDLGSGKATAPAQVIVVPQLDYFERFNNK